MKILFDFIKRKYQFMKLMLTIRFRKKEKWSPEVLELYKAIYKDVESRS